MRALRVAVGVLVATLGVQEVAGGVENKPGPIKSPAAENKPAPTKSPAANAVEVRIGAVLASNSGKDFDARLASLHHQFNALFPYSSYRLVKEDRQQVPWGTKVGFDIPGGRYLLVIPKGFKNGRVSMTVMIIEGSRPIVDTALSLRNHGTFLVCGPHGNQGVLILSIGADALH